MEDGDNSGGYLHIVWAPIASVGWYIVGIMVITLYAFPRIQGKYENWKQSKAERNGTIYSKKTEELPQLSANVELARQKMQEAYNKSCIAAEIKEEEKKERKQQVLELLGRTDTGNRLGSTEDSELPSTSTKSRRFKSDYNPLTGDNNRGYRPPKRSCCGKGGCG